MILVVLNYIVLIKNTASGCMSPRRIETMKRIILIFGVMKTSRFNEGQIIKAIKEHEGGRKAEDTVRDLGISQGTFYKWKQTQPTKIL